MKTSRIFFSILTLLIPLQGYAAVDPSGQNVLNNIEMAFKNTASAWQTVMITYASHLFWSLALISMVWTFASTLGKRDDISSAFFDIIRFFVTTGFFWWLLIHGPAISTDIIQSLCNIAAQASGIPDATSPSGIINIGLEIAKQVATQESILTPVDDVVGLITSIIIMGSLTVVAINMVLQFIAAWILAYAGVFLLGFGGSNWTSDMAIKYFRDILSLGMGIFAMILIVGIGKSFINQYYTAITQNAAAHQSMQLQDLFVMLIVSIILLTLVNKVPPMLSGIVGGSNFSGIGLASGAGAVGMAASAAGGAVMGAAANAAGGASALKAAFQGAKDDAAAAQETAKEKNRNTIGGNHQPAKTQSAFSKLAQGVNASAKQSMADRVGKTSGGKVASAIKEKQTPPKADS